ncbi:DUF5677 domain-containing protein [Streptomyces sp. 1222.5]|uniref:DUF5677 domain-containing protein n=1 Tax=Streptomyces sp. 1222.5 TaxID=1881026 RepID=UPI003D724D74
MNDAEQDKAFAYKGLQDLARVVEEVGPMAPAHEDDRAFRVAWGLLAAANRQAAVIVLLHRYGMGYDTSPNRRALLEHAARIWWLAEDGADAVDSMNRALQRSQAALRKASDAAGIKYDATIADIVAGTELPPNKAETYNHFAHLMERMGPPMLAIWIGESMTAHPTLTGAQLFAREESGVLSLLAEPEYPAGFPGPDERAPTIALVLMWHAMCSFNRLLDGEPWTDDLQRIAAEAGIDGSVTGKASTSDVA